jgi:hypothetical protein
LLDHLGVVEETASADSTGFRPSHASACYQSRTGRRCRDWLKGAYGVGTASLLILGWGSAAGSQSDFHFLRPLKRQVAAYGKRHNGRRAWILLADAGFDALGVARPDLIPPIRRNGKMTDPRRRAWADWVAAARLDGLFGQRWKSETVNSVIRNSNG